MTKIQIFGNCSSTAFPNVRGQNHWVIKAYLAFLFSLFVSNFIELILVLVGAVNATELDVTEVDFGISLFPLDIRRVARVLRAGALGASRHLRVAVWRGIDTSVVDLLYVSAPET